MMGSKDQVIKQKNSSKKTLLRLDLITLLEWKNISIIGSNINFEITYSFLGTKEKIINLFEKLWNCDKKKYFNQG